MQVYIDTSIINSSPIIRKAEWLGRYQLKKGLTQHADTHYRHVEFTDVTSWFRFGQKTV